MNAVILESESNQNLDLVLALAKKLGVKSREVPARQWRDQSPTTDQQGAGPFVQTQANPLLADSLRLVLDYAQALQKIDCHDYTLSNSVFTRIIQTILAYGVSTEKISVGRTEDDSLLVRGKAGSRSFYFETYFDEEEYEAEYEVIANVYQDKKNLVSVAGSIDYVLQKLNARLVA